MDEEMGTMGAKRIRMLLFVCLFFYSAKRSTQYKNQHNNLDKIQYIINDRKRFTLKRQPNRYARMTHKVGLICQLISNGVPKMKRDACKKVRNKIMTKDKATNGSKLRIKNIFSQLLVHGN
jgi:hypothetical protein